MFVCVCVCVCVCVLLGQHFFIDTNLIKPYRIFCLHIFVFIISSCYIDFIISGRNYLINLPLLFVTLVLSVRSWAIIRGVLILSLQSLI